MSEYLVLRLHADEPDRVSWVVADSSGQQTSMAETGTLADVAHRAQTRPVVVLVPGQDVLLTKIDLPVRGASKMLQAAPCALEEELADSVSVMHFALGPRDSTGKVTVAAVREPLMQLWTAQLDEAGLEAAYLLPDTAGIPVHDGWTIVIDGEICLIRDSQGRVIVGDTESAPAYIGAMATGDQTDSTADLYVSATDSTRYSQLLSQIHLSLPEASVTELRHGALPVIAATAIKKLQPNLLQGTYAKSTGREKLWGPWRAAALLAGVFVLTALGAKALEVMSLKSELRALNTELNEIASEAMPGKRIVDPMRQLEQLAASLDGGAEGGETDFLDMLDSLSEAMTTAGSATLEKLDYRNGTMDLTLTVPSIDTLDQISRTIADSGLSAEIQSSKANEGSDDIRGRLRITGQKS